MDTVSNGGFLPFAAGAFFRRCRASLAANTAPATTTCGTTSLPVRLSIADQIPERISGRSAERMAGLRHRVLAQRLAIFGLERAVFGQRKRHRSGQRTAVSPAWFPACRCTSTIRFPA